MDFYENFNLPPNTINKDENDIFAKRQLLYNSLEEIDEKSNIQEKDKSKLSLRKKKYNEYISKYRKNKLKQMEAYCKTNYSINYNELIKQIPNEIISEFNNSKNKYEFYITYLSIPDIKDPNFYIRMFVIYQLHNFVNNDITNSSRPSPELEHYLLKYLVNDYKNEHLNQKIKIQNEIIEMLIIWSSYSNDDNINNIFYEDQFIYFLFSLLENNFYSIEFKINILILFNTLIKGINTFNKIILRYEIIDKIEKVYSQIKKDEQYIYILSLIETIFEYMNKYDDMHYNFNNINNNNNNKVCIFMNSYENFILLMKTIYEKYQVIYEQNKINRIPLSLDKSSRIYYKIIVKILQILNYSIFLEENKFYINVLISNEYALPLFYKILEIFSKEFFLSNNDNNTINHLNKFNISNNLYIESNSSIKYKEKNNIYKKIKIISFITNILDEIISTISENENEIKKKGATSDLVLKFMNKFNFINYYTNLLKNFICLNIIPDKILILRIEELIYNFCVVNRDNFTILYKNSDLIRDLLEINIKNYNKENFQLLIKFIINSLELYDTEITGSLIFNVKIIGTFCKYLENHFNNDNLENISYILYALNDIINSKTYRKCKLNRNLIIYEFNKNNASHILEQYGTKINDEKDYMIINEILSNLDETDILDNNQLEEIFNPSEEI